MKRVARGESASQQVARHSHSRYPSRQGNNGHSNDNSGSPVRHRCVDFRVTCHNGVGPALPHCGMDDRDQSYRNRSSLLRKAACCSGVGAGPGRSPLHTPDLVDRCLCHRVRGNPHHPCHPDQNGGYRLNAGGAASLPQARRQSSLLWALYRRLVCVGRVSGRAQPRAVFK